MQGRTRSKHVGEWVGIFIAAVLAALLIKAYVAQTFWIPSASMEQTLLINDRVLVNKLSYRVGSVERGDVVVFKRPAGQSDQEIEDLIKRVIAVPGETIEAKDGVVFVNGEALVEPYLQPGVRTVDLPRRSVPEGTLFVMGDNRGNSHDSRRFGPIDRSTVVGKASYRIWPISRVSTL